MFELRFSVQHYFQFWETNYNKDPKILIWSAKLSQIKNENPAFFSEQDTLVSPPNEHHTLEAEQEKSSSSFLTTYWVWGSWATWGPVL